VSGTEPAVVLLGSAQWVLRPAPNDESAEMKPTDHGADDSTYEFVCVSGGVTAHRTLTACNEVPESVSVDGMNGVQRSSGRRWGVPGGET
jgi:hypothetical protein